MTSAGNKRANSPDRDEIEVSIFGPGFGECVVVHFGNGDWCVVDSCINPASQRPIALDYLESINVDVGQSVRCLIATHWHDDHIKGISSVFLAAKSAKFVCTAAISKKEFQPILACWGACQRLPGGSGVNELRDVLSELKNRKKDTKFPSPALASADKILWQRSENPPVVIKSLSPSDAAIVAATARFTNFAADPSRIRRRIPNIRPNDSSVVLSIGVEKHSVLLGADLEMRADSGLGWNAVLESNHQAEQRHGFKVPHHGSPTAHSDQIWTKLLVPTPWAVTTPFVSGKIRLPGADDCKRILNFTPHAYLTGAPGSGKFRDANKTVEKTVKEFTRSVHIIPAKFGHVRLRKKIVAQTDSTWDVELFGSATSMQSITKITE